MSLGRVFQKVEAATENERRPTVDRRYGGTSSCCVNDDRNRRRQVVHTDVPRHRQSSLLYGVVAPQDQVTEQTVAVCVDSRPRYDSGKVIHTNLPRYGVVAPQHRVAEQTVAWGSPAGVRLWASCSHPGASLLYGVVKPLLDGYPLQTTRPQVLTLSIGLIFSWLLVKYFTVSNSTRAVTS